MPSVKSARASVHSHWTNRQLAETVTALFWEEEVTGVQRGLRPTNLKSREAARKYFQRLAESGLEVRAIE